MRPSDAPVIVLSPSGINHSRELWSRAQRNAGTSLDKPREDTVLGTGTNNEPVPMMALVDEESTVVRKSQDFSVGLDGGF
jgi:hypothetical protein